LEIERRGRRKGLLHQQPGSLCNDLKRLLLAGFAYTDQKRAMGKREAHTHQHHLVLIYTKNQLLARGESVLTIFVPLGENPVVNRVFKWDN